MSITTAMTRNAMGIITMMAAVMSITIIIMQTRCLPAGEWKPLFR
ncbi:hypothetical protein CLOBOL_02048 [Enterocloster bolteae ATCC BAA-613]|uniref:Uncharacterized protein n=1 Tax=Enterocloster bolteae (strain ATCC BAA-613 / DSM 15670 / CCUG 46953 / JCM 12243 / WAL 16351) TaxID=411902 RepID=A8RMW6_ENTBW|nr:hypothetical protein CLOBOL_02048 [Enterocloster bolteae ATCC BAA-613]